FGAGYTHEMPELVRKTAFHGDGTCRLHSESHPVLAVDISHSRLELEVVRPEQLAETSGVVGAAGVLEKERVIERGAVGRVHVQLAAQAHADQAGAHRVADGLTFREIQRTRKRGNHL